MLHVHHVSNACQIKGKLRFQSDGMTCHYSDNKIYFFYHISSENARHKKILIKVFSQVKTFVIMVTALVKVIIKDAMIFGLNVLRIKQSSGTGTY